MSALPPKADIHRRQEFIRLRVTSCAVLSVSGYQRMIARAGKEARFPFLVHSHMLRHSCGYKLANDDQDTRAIQHYLGHKSINSTVRYTALAPDRFKGFWKD
jgi:type 1 fimbriae regulatory protein FimB/type 1 fimbriae regulatory protein FimE